MCETHVGTQASAPPLCVTRQKQSKPSNTQESKYTFNPAEGNRKKQCRPTEAKINSTAIHPRLRHKNPTHTYTPSRIKSKHTSRPYTGICPHAPGQQAGGHLVPAKTECHNPPKVWTHNGKHEAPRKLSAHRGTGIAADQAESKVSGLGLEEAVEGGGMCV